MISNEILRTHYRVNDKELLSSSELNDYNEKGDAANITPLVFAETGNKFYGTYEQCFDEVLKGQFATKQPDDPYWIWPKQFEEEGNLEFLIEMEAKYESCAGVCETPLFYVSKPLSEGMPT